MFDLAGTVDGFVRAVRDIEGIDFLADLIGDEFDPDDDFFLEDGDGERTDRAVTESIYMLMANARAIDELISLFNRWVADPSVTFPRGMAPLKQVFANLRSIRRWGAQDRVRETGLLDEWQETLDVVGQSGMARVEIELWYREAPEDRRAAEQQVAAIVADGGGIVRTSTDVAEIRYDAILADIPYHQVAVVLEQGVDAIELLTTDSVMFVTPSRPMTVEAPTPADVTAEYRDILPTGLPRVALLDGLPMSNHRALDGRLIIDDPDDVTGRYGAAPRSHGTAMASLICHGDMSTSNDPITAPVYLRPLLQPHPLHPARETTPPDELLVDLVHRSFVRMFEGDGGNAPVAPSVRIVNLSLGDPARVFTRQMSPLARLLDWLSDRYNCLIVVSAGNHPGAVEASHAEIDGDLTDARKAVARRLRAGAGLRRMLSPAEAVNVVTVGSTHDDGSDGSLPDTVIDLVERGAPAPYTPAGTGYRRAVKPDVLLPGGRQVHVRPPDGSDLGPLTAARTEVAGPGILAAGPGSYGALDGTVYTHGTSNSAALASRHLDRILDYLSSWPTQTGLPPAPDAQYHPVVAKAMLVHAAAWGDAADTLMRQLGISGLGARKELIQLLGYGPVASDRLIAADRVRAVLVGGASTLAGERRTFRYPLPPSLAATTEWRRLTLTLAWISPVNARSQKYRKARLLLSPPADDLALRRVEAPHYAPGRGTVHHEILDGRDAVAFTAGDSLEINVDCRADAGTLDRPVRFGLVASLEVGQAVRIDLQAEVEEQLRLQVNVPVRPRLRPPT